MLKPRNHYSFFYPPRTFSLFSTSGHSAAARTQQPCVFPSGDVAGDPSISSRILLHKDLLRKKPNSPDTLLTLELIDSGSLDPTIGLYSRLIKKCTELKKLHEGRIVDAHLLDSPFKSDIFFRNSIVNMYCKCGGLEDARKAFDEMPQRDVVTWTAMITGYAQNGRPADALELFSRMLRARVDPNQFTFASALKAAGAVAADDDRIGKQLHAVGLKYNYCSDVFVGSSLLDMYARGGGGGTMDEACLVFDRLRSKNEVSWNALIAGYARKEQGEAAIKKFWEMQRSGFKPTHITYSIVFGACAGIGALEQGKWVHAHMIKSGEKLVTFIGNTMIDMYAKSGSIEDAAKVFDRLLDKAADVVTWNTLLTGFAQHGLAEEAIRLFERMRRIGVQPNSISFLCVLNACSHGGLLNEGRRYFSMMEEYELEPDVDHYVTVVDLLSRAGLLQDAYRLIDEMPMPPTAAVWGALLGACRMHKNVELGRVAAERVFELDPGDSGPHVILYNIYASARRWSDAAGVRKAMRASRLKKEPACSWVEMENKVHVFVANDKSHPQIKEILKKWDEISLKIREAGYVPDTDHVLLHVDDQEREAKLQSHSEKLALAFSLLNSPSGVAVVRIMKNLRMCGDCHSAFKLVSKVMERKIIVRDTNRFHHFSNGSCSCGNYW